MQAGAPLSVKPYKNISEFFSNKNLDRTLSKLRSDNMKSNMFLVSYYNENSAFNTIDKAANSTLAMSSRYSAMSSTQRKIATANIPLKGKVKMPKLQVLDQFEMPTMTIEGKPSSNSKVPSNNLNSKKAITHQSKFFNDSDVEFRISDNFNKGIHSNINNLGRDIDPLLIPGRTANRLNIFQNQNLKVASPDFDELDAKRQQKEKEKRNKKEIDYIYKKVFDKKYEYLMRPKLIRDTSEVKTRSPVKKKTLPDQENRNDTIFSNKSLSKNTVAEPRHKYIYDKILGINSKIFFMKSIYDYCYPQVIIKRLKEEDKLFRKKNLKIKLISIAKERKLREKGKFKIEELIEVMDKFGIEDVNTNYKMRVREQEFDIKNVKYNQATFVTNDFNSTGGALDNTADMYLSKCK